MVSNLLVKALFFVALSTFVSFAAASCTVTANTNVNLDDTGNTNAGAASCGTSSTHVSSGTLANSDTCYFSCDAGFRDTSSNSADDILATCAPAGIVFTSNDPSAACTVAVCDAPPTVSGYTDVNCGSVSRTNFLQTSGSTSRTCSVTIAAATGTADFSSGSGSKTTSYTCNNVGVNTYTSPAPVAACDTYPTSTNTGLPSGSFSGGCTSLTTSPVKGDGTGTCSVNPTSPYFNFASSSSLSGSQTAIPLTCTGGNTWSTTVTVAPGCSSKPTSSTIMPSAISTALDYTTSATTTDCTSASTSNAFQQTAGSTLTCNMNTATGYYDFSSGTAATTTPVTCTTASTNTFTALNSLQLLAGCSAAPADAAHAGITTNAVGVDVTSGSCTTVPSSSNVFKSGDTTATCSVGTKVANRYYDLSVSPPASTFDVSCSGVNQYTTSTASIGLACSNANGNTLTFASPTSHVALGSCGTVGPLANGDKCQATCDASSSLDSTQTAGTTSSPGVLTYQCSATTNTLTLVGSTPNCIPNGCTAPPALSDMYDFTAGSTPCASVDASTHKISVGGTCTLKCKTGYAPKNNVAPTFTCDSTTQTLLPTNFDICVPLSQLPITFFTYGTKLP